MGLARMGPKLLVSDRSTADQPFLRWQLQVRGRNACVEFGVVPETHLVRAWCLFCTARAWSVKALSAVTHLLRCGAPCSPCCCSQGLHAGLHKTSA